MNARMRCGQNKPLFYMNFANKTQRHVGLSLTASEYLHLERSRGIALTIGAAQSHERGNISTSTLAAIAGETPPAGIESEGETLERLVAAAEPAALAMDYGDAAVKELASWLQEKVGPGSPARLARQLGWPL